MVAESAGFSIKDNPNRFIPTPYRWGNQRIYQEIGTHYYWYYDFNHNENGRPHHEIFDRLGNQLGTDNMDGRLDVTKNKGYSISDILNT